MGRKRGEGEILIKTVLIGLISFSIISMLLITLGNFLKISWLMFSFELVPYGGFEAGGSIFPFIIAFIGTYFIGNYYEKKHSYRA